MSDERQIAGWESELNGPVEMVDVVSDYPEWDVRMTERYFSNNEAPTGRDQLPETD